MVTKLTMAQVADNTKKRWNNWGEVIKVVKGYMPQDRLSEQLMNGIVDEVFIQFEKVADEIQLKAEEDLERSKAADLLSTNVYDRKIKHEYLLLKTENHALEIAKLIRPYPDKKFFCLLRLIAGRVSSPPPFLLPVLGDAFKYVHFNYVSRFGLVSVPPRPAIINSNNRNLGVVWHEVAGYAIAVAKTERKEEFKRQAKALRDHLRVNYNLWFTYRDLYIRSVSKSLGNQPQFPETESAAIEKAVEQTLSQDKHLDVLDEDFSWQVTWLSEILEDLFWIMATEDDPLKPESLVVKAIRMQANALLATYYPHLKIGDIDHPSPHLRVLVSIAYVCPGDKNLITQIINKFLSDIEPLGLAEAEDQDIDLAISIADFCREALKSPASSDWLYGTDVKPIERDAANIVLNPSDDMADKLGNLLGSCPPEATEACLTQFRKDQGTAKHIYKQIRDALDLKALLNIEFTSEDQWPTPPF